MSEILLSLPASWFIMRVILQVKYFPGLNMLAIFIVCAIGQGSIKLSQMHQMVHWIFVDAAMQWTFFVQKRQ
jgi:hypothetical protein